MWVETLRQARRIIVAVIGFTVLLVGIVMIVTPGPGWLVILLGLSILSAEFVWARRWLRRIKKTGSDLVRTVRGESKGVPGQKA
jgi:tellurite resistance protein TerC